MKIFRLLMGLFLLGACSTLENTNNDMGLQNPLLATLRGMTVYGENRTQEAVTFSEDGQSIIIHPYPLSFIPSYTGGEIEGTLIKTSSSSLEYESFVNLPSGRTKITSVFTLNANKISGRYTVTIEGRPPVMGNYYLTQL